MRERRIHRRHDAFIALAVEDESALRWAALTSNLSRTGALVWTQALVVAGQTVTLHLERGGLPSRIEAVVVREAEVPASDAWWSRQVAVRFGAALPETWVTLLDDLDIFERLVEDETAETEVVVVP
jgi:hypothetical protein